MASAAWPRLKITAPVANDTVSLSTWVAINSIGLATAATAINDVPHEAMSRHSGTAAETKRRSGTQSTVSAEILIFSSAFEEVGQCQLELSVLERQIGTAVTHHR